MASRTVTVKIEFTPLGKSLIRLAEIIRDADMAMIPDEVRAAALDTLALAQERFDD